MRQSHRASQGISPTSIAICPDLTVEQLPELFAYNARSGLLTWRKNPTKKNRLAGKVVGYIRGNYRVLPYNGKSYGVHRIVWALHYGRWPKMIDHADGNGLNNRLANLRECTAAQNAQNSKLSANSTTGFKGVSWHSAKKMWRAGIMADGVTHRLGYFDTEEEAAEAYDAAAIRLHKDFAKTNADLQPKSEPYMTGEPNYKTFDSRHGPFRGL